MATQAEAAARSPEPTPSTVKGVKRVAVLGAGTMGHGIAQLAALVGYDVVIRDVEDRFLDGGLEKVRWSLGKLVEKKRITKEQAELAFQRIGKTTELKTAVAGSDLVIEAVPEDLQLKKETFKEIDRYASDGAILASNTSSLPIDEIAKATSRPQDVVGMHFFNPPQLMPLVEIILGTVTTEAVARAADELAWGLGKETIICRKYVPGFVVNNILGALNRPAMIIFERGEATAEEMDSALKFKAGFPMGLFELHDFSGIDIAYNVQKFFESRGYETDAGPLKRLVEEGRLGAKTGRGFYEWKDGKRPQMSAEAGKRMDVTPIIASGVNAAAELLRQGVATREDVDKGIKLGLGFPKGILEMGDEMGLDVILSSLDSFYAKHGKAGREPSQLLVELVKGNRLGRKTGSGFYDYGSKPPGTEFETILLKVEASSGIAWLTLNRPQRLNTITPTMMAELSRALDQLEQDGSVRVLVIRGAGEKAFSAGADVTSFQHSTASSMLAGSQRGDRVFGRVESFPHPVVAAIRGYCLGGGCELSMACDFRIASSTALIGLPETSLGIIPGWGGTQRMTRLLGETKAKELILLAERLGAEEAHRVGLVTRVVPDGEFEREVKEFAERLAAGAPVALELAKRAIGVAAGAKGPGESGFEFEAHSAAIVSQTEDAAEGVSAFLSKRKPGFKGK